MAKKLVTGGDRTMVPWQNIGQTVEGTLLRVESTARSGKFLAMVDKDGGEFVVSAPTTLARTVEKHLDDLEGKEIKITFTKQDKPKNKGESGVMYFEVDYDEDEGK